MYGPALEASYGLTRRGGRLVTLSAPPSAQRAEQLGIHAMFFVVTPDAAQLSRLAELTDSGKFRPVVSQVFPLREGREAFESGTRLHPPGKTVQSPVQPGRGKADRERAEHDRQRGHADPGRLGNRELRAEQDHR